MSARGSAVVAALFVALLGWVVWETRGGDLGLAERLTASVQTCWPFVVALIRRRAHPRIAAGPGAAGRRGGARRR